jgi:hypothetical protein
VLLSNGSAVLPQEAGRLIGLPRGANFAGTRLSTVFEGSVGGRGIRLSRKACQNDLQYPHGPRLVQRFVAVSALRRLNAGGAAVRALAGLDRLQGRGQPRAGQQESAFGEAGAANAALFAAAMLANEDAGIRERLIAFRTRQTETVLAAELPTELPEA